MAANLRNTPEPERSNLMALPYRSRLNSPPRSKSRNPETPSILGHKVRPLGTSPAAPLTPPATPLRPSSPSKAQEKPVVTDTDASKLAAALGLDNVQLCGGQTLSKQPCRKASPAAKKHETLSSHLGSM